MTSLHIGRHYIEEAGGRTALVRLALERGMWAATVGKAQECVELCLRGALWLVVVEPTRSQDVAAALRSEALRFPEWFRSSINALVMISMRLDADRDQAFYGDEERELGPQELFDEEAARRSVRDVELVAELCGRLLSEIHAN